MLLAGASCSLLVACTEEESKPRGAKIPPVIESVSAAQQEVLTPTTVGYADNMYVIQGKGFATVQKIFFNDTDTSFNPALVTDTAIFVTIDRDTPYADASNKLRIETLYGTAEFDFVVAPPAPGLDSFNPINASTGETVTIYGSFFLDPVVTFGDIPATVISNSLTEIQVTVPDGANHQYVTVTTISGSDTSIEAVGTAVYDDVYYNLNSATSSLWNGNDVWDPNWTEDSFQGQKAIKLQLGGWNGIDMRFSVPVDLTPYKALRIAVKASAVGTVKYLFNDNWAITPNMPVTTEWTVIEILFSEMGNPATFTGITFQESGNFGGNTVLMDDIGFVLND